ncbi:hypothetical protein [Bosea sp. MMO-172]|uniref:hypothetical protein n=1 Tax=Bosea sp. MMO-172 TaxID=3127885 RepID=UPI00301695A6
MIRVTDHALVRFLERSGALDVERLRAMISGSLERGRKIAERAGIAEYTISADGLKYIVEDGELVTVLDSSMRQKPGASG